MKLCPECKTTEMNDQDTNDRCWKCHNQAVAVYREKQKAWLEDQKQKGQEYWRSRGIAVGETVVGFAPSLLGLGGQDVIGIAKVGRVGAYVSSTFQKGYLSPEFSRKQVRR